MKDPRLGITPSDNNKYKSLHTTRLNLNVSEKSGTILTYQCKVHSNDSIKMLCDRAFLKT